MISLKDKNIFQDIQPVSLLERIKLLFVKAQYDYDYENGTIIKYKKMNNQLYILQMIFMNK